MVFAFPLPSHVTEYFLSSWFPPLTQGLVGTLSVASLVIVLLASGWLPDVAKYLELLPLPQALPPQGSAGATAGSELLALMAADFGTCFVIEKSVSYVFKY